MKESVKYRIYLTFYIKYTIIPFTLRNSQLTTNNRNYNNYSISIRDPGMTVNS